MIERFVIVIIPLYPYGSQRRPSPARLISEKRFTERIVDGVSERARKQIYGAMFSLPKSLREACIHQHLLLAIGD